MSATANNAAVTRINVEATREAEPRASLSTLPEFIKRATKLAANLDRGITASRLGVDAWVNEKLPSSPGHGADSLSDVLGPLPQTDVTRTKSQDSAAAGRPRRCGGMPLWVAILVFIIIIIIIASAIIIPVALAVVPRHDKNTGPSSSTPKALVQCQQTLPPA